MPSIRATRCATRSALPDLANAIGQDAAQREARRELPFEGFAIFRRSALGVLRIPVERGGLGGTLVDLFDTIATLAAADSNLAHALRIHYDQIETLRLSPRTPFNDVQLERALAGAIFGGASTERGTSRPGENTTVLRRDGDHYRVTGRKYYSTGTAFADFARINVENEQGDAVAVIIPVARDGVQVLDDWDGMGQRMTASGSLLLNDVQVFADEVAARDGSTLVGRHCGALRQLHLVATGRASCATWLPMRAACSRTAARCCTARRRPHATIISSSRSSASCPRTVMQSTSRARNARALDRSADAIEAGDADAHALVLDSALATARTQLIVSKLALHAAERLFEVGGASATAREHNLDRHWRNLRTIFSHNPLLHKARVIGDYELNGVTTHLTEGRVF